ncbi:MAG: universal stress protein [bacterium]|nr:universal stress protein [bacterium]
MFPFKKILCPTDFSEASICGIKMAREMVEKFNSEIILLNVHKPIPHLPSPRMEASDITFDVSAYEEVIVSEAKTSLEEIRQEFLGPEAMGKVLVHIGSPAKEILKVADEEKVEAIFIATHGHTGLSKMVFGSVAERIVRKAHCPVLTIRSCE